MKSPPLISIGFVVLACGALNSCASWRHPKNNPDAPAESTATAAAETSHFKFPHFSFASLLPRPRVQVVQVREKDLKPLPTGHERALAFESKHSRGFWFFGGPVDFKEPSLPEAGSELDGSLLPPRMP
jgi:hypothetical protein